MADNERDEHGRFAAGNHPVTGFHTNPERRGRFPGNRHSFSKAAQRLLDMTDSQLEAERKRTDLCVLASWRPLCERCFSAV